MYRAETREDLEDLAALGSHLVATLLANPQDVTTPLVTWTDLDPILVPPYGAKPSSTACGRRPVRQRQRAVGRHQRGGARHPAAGADRPRRSPARRTTSASVEAEHRARPRRLPDLPWRLRPRLHLRPRAHRTKNKDGKVETRGETRCHCDMTLVGDVPLGDAKIRLAADGEIWFEDFSVPEGSPLCYGYWVRAYDQAGNLYAQPSGCPQAGGVRCARLREDAAAGAGDDRV